MGMSVGGGEMGAGDPPKTGCTEGEYVGRSTTNGAALLGDAGLLEAGALALLLVYFLPGGTGLPGGSGSMTGSFGGNSKGNGSNRRVNLVWSLRRPRTRVTEVVSLIKSSPQSPLHVTTTCKSTENGCACVDETADVVVLF